MSSGTGLETFPDIILVIGTDASGKDHVATLLEKMIQEAGGQSEKRKRYLAGKTTNEASSVRKGGCELFLEKTFLFLYPLLGFCLPWLLRLVLERDLKKFRRSEGKLIIVGHNCLRGLAFHWGHRYQDVNSVRFAPSLKRSLAKLRSIKGLHTLVLDLDDSIRKERIRKRELQGEADYFDKYMVADSVRSENIESMLIWLSKEYVGAQLIENNDLSEAELRKRILRGFELSQR